MRKTATLFFCFIDAHKWGQKLLEAWEKLYFAARK